MSKNQYIVAIEVGSSKIIGAVATKSPDGMISFVAMDEEKLVDCIRYGCIKNVEETSTRIVRIIQKLENRASIKPRKIKHVYVGIGGRSVRIIKKEIERVLPSDTTINEELIETMRKEARKEIFDGFEILDVVPERFYVDKAETKNPIGMVGSKVVAHFNLVIGKEQIKANLKRVLNERLQLNVKEYLVTALASADQVLTNEERQLGCMLVDFGAETTTVSIYKNNALTYLYTMPIGSRNITRDITSLNVLEETAEQIKKSIGNALEVDKNNNLEIEGIKTQDAANYIVARSGEIVANIVAQLEAAGLTTGNIPGGIVTIGGGANLPGFVELIAKQTKLKVRKGIPNNEVNILDTKANNLEYVTIVSLVAEAAHRIADDFTCCPLPPSTEEPIGQTGGTEETKTVEIKPTVPQKKSDNKLKRFLVKIRKSTEAAFTDTDDEDDDE